MLIIAAALLAIGLMYLGLQRRSAIRSGARLVLGLLTLLGLAVTGFCLYAAVAWSDRGGGVLFLFAMPAGFITWLLASGFLASARHEPYYDLTVEQKIAYNVALADQTEADLRLRLKALMAERERFFLGARRRRELDEEMARIRGMMGNLPKLRDAVQKPEIYSGDER